MASKRLGAPARQLLNGHRATQDAIRSHRCLVRSMATETSTPEATLSQAYIDAHLDSAPTKPILEDRPSDAVSQQGTSQTRAYQQPPNPFRKDASVALHSFPRLEPTSIVTYPGTHLLVPLRKDLLHRAVVYEGDMTRQGTASTKWRSEVHGSNRKIRPQKGTGMARLGDKKSPMLRGGGVAFGPKPRDFSTELPKKVYDLAWRTALSYRYRKGELIVTEGKADIDIPEGSARRYLWEMLRFHRMGQPDGRTLFISSRRREGLFKALEQDNMEREARAIELHDVDVKNLLELGRVVVERRALENMLSMHQSDLGPSQRFSPQAEMVAPNRNEQLQMHASTS